MQAPTLRCASREQTTAAALCVRCERKLDEMTAGLADAEGGPADVIMSDVGDRLFGVAPFFVPRGVRLAGSATV